VLRERSPVRCPLVEDVLIFIWLLDSHCHTHTKVHINVYATTTTSTITTFTTITTTNTITTTTTSSSSSSSSNKREPLAATQPREAMQIHQSIGSGREMPAKKKRSG
jgi:guanyl-specific ribonuclease Sa